VYALDPNEQEQWRKQGWGAFLRLIQNDVDERSSEKVSEGMSKLGLGTLPRDVLSERPPKNWAVVGDVTINESDNFCVNLVDVGYGAAQVLPIIVESVVARGDALVIIEQPELHLHPGAQAELADLLIEAATRTIRLRKQNEHKRKAAREKGKTIPAALTEEELSARKVNFLIETHSEHILLRLRRRIAETTIEKFNFDSQHYFPHESLHAYFVNRDPDTGESQVESINIHSDGSMDRPTGFKDFFAEDMKETAYLASAQLGVEVDLES
jgi:hypothetical protein